MADVSGKARTLIHKVTPRDSRIGGNDMDIRMKKMSAFGMAMWLIKAADATAAIRKAEQAIKGVAKAQHTSLVQKLDESQKRMAELEQQNQELQQQMGEQGQMMQGMMAPGPQPPAAQPPYGAMLRQQQMAEQESQKAK